MPKINTAKGPMDSFEASQLFAREDHQDTNFLLGIYHQLLERSITDAAHATQLILANPDRFNHTIVKLAQKHQFDSPGASVPQPTHVTTWPNLSPKENELLTGNPQLFYGEDLFRRTCAHLEHAQLADQWVKNINDSNAEMNKALAAVPFMLRTMFLEKYIELFALELQV